jgi:hypothetical protein
MGRENFLSGYVGQARLFDLLNMFLLFPQVVLIPDFAHHSFSDGGLFHFITTPYVQGKSAVGLRRAGPTFRSFK